MHSVTVTVGFVLSSESLNRFEFCGIRSFLNRLIKCGYDFVIVSASGNGSSTETGNLDSRYNSFINNINETEYPAVFSRIIVVGSINSNFEISTFSNAGNRVDIFAPGENIYSTVPSTNRYEADGWSGTSMASPHVAGVCANVWSMNNNLTGAEVKQIVCDINNCVQHVNVRFSLPNSDTQLTRGIVDCYRAVTNSRVTNEKRNNTDPESNMGSVLGWVVERDENQNDNFLSAAVIRAYQHGQTEPVHFSSIDRDFEVSDIYGHFELILNPGTYDISVQYGNYEVKRKENITVEAGQVHYLNEYIVFEKPKEPQTTTIIQDAEKKTVTTTEVPPAQTPAVIDPYEELLKRYSSDEYYMLVDLIGDSNLELIIRTGTCEADFMFEFWYNDNSNPICMGETGGGHSSLHINPNTKELYRNYAHMDFQEISKISINYNSVSDEKIAKFGDAKHTNSFYTEHYYYNMDIPCITEKYISEYKYEASALSYEYCETMTLEEYTQRYREAEKKAATSSVSEDELKDKAQNYGNIEYWAYYDFDGNGQKEAFALITSQSDADPSGDYYQKIEHILYLNAAGDIKDIPGDYMDYVNGTGVFFTTSDGRGWFSIAHTAQGPSSPNLLYGVYNDMPSKKDDLNLDGGIIVNSNGSLSAWITYAPPRTYEEYELLYDESTTEFYLGEKLKEE